MYETSVLEKATPASTLEVGKKFNPYKIFNGAFVPLGIMAHPELSPGSKLLYGNLSLHKAKKGEEGQCNPSLATLAKELSASVDIVGRWLQELTEQKLIKRRRMGQGRPAECDFLWHEVLENSLRKGTIESANLRSQSPGLNPQICGDDSAETRSLDSAKLRFPIKEEKKLPEETLKEGEASEREILGSVGEPEADPDARSLPVSIEGQTPEPEPGNTPDQDAAFSETVLENQSAEVNKTQPRAKIPEAEAVAVVEITPEVVDGAELVQEALTAATHKPADKTIALDLLAMARAHGCEQPETLCQFIAHKAEEKRKRHKHIESNGLFRVVVREEFPAWIELPRCEHGTVKKSFWSACVKCAAEQMEESRKASECKHGAPNEHLCLICQDEQRDREIRQAEKENRRDELRSLAMRKGWSELYAMSCNNCVGYGRNPETEAVCSCVAGQEYERIGASLAAEIKASDEARERVQREIHQRSTNAQRVAHSPERREPDPNCTRCIRGIVQHADRFDWCACTEPGAAKAKHASDSPPRSPESERAFAAEVAA